MFLGLRTAVVIPAFNEAPSLGDVVSRARRHGAVLVVDDGSTDRTAAVATSAGAEVLSFGENRGLRAGLAAGYTHARDRGYAYAGRVDADGQHPVDELARLLELVRSDACDVAVGSRFAAGEGYDDERYRLLDEVGDLWKDKVGNNASVSWPAPTSSGGKGNEGVASFVQRIRGAIGYVEYAYAKQNKMAYTLLQNKDGIFVAPNDKTFQSAAAGADWKSVPGMGVVLTNQPGKQSWPITGASFILIHTQQANPAAAKEVLKFFEWSFKNGQQMASDLDYVPMPDPVVSLIRTEWKANIKDASGMSVY